MPLPIFAFCGPEIGQRNDAVLEIRKKIKTPPDSYVFYATETPIAEVISLLQNISLFADARFVEMRNSEVIKKKEDIELISTWLKSADANSVLVLTTDEISLDKKLETLVPKENKKIFWELFEDRKEQWLFDFFKRAGFLIEPDAIETILELVENNTEALRNECGRFFLCLDPKSGQNGKPYTVTQEDVENILSHNREESAFTLFDALCDTSKNKQTRFENALLILQKLRLSKESSSVALIAGLTFCFRKLCLWQELHAHANPSDFDLKTNGFTGKKAIEQYRRAQKTWTLKQTYAALGSLSQADFDVRSGGTVLEQVQMQLLLYSLVCK